MKLQDILTKIKGIGSKIKSYVPFIEKNWIYILLAGVTIYAVIQTIRYNYLSSVYNAAVISTANDTARVTDEINALGFSLNQAGRDLTDSRSTVEKQRTTIEGLDLQISKLRTASSGITSNLDQLEANQQGLTGSNQSAIDINRQCRDIIQSIKNGLQ